MLIEANIDALVGPSHHFGGLGIGNVASMQHAGQGSNPRDSALEGLRKAALVASLGVPQFFWLPPVPPRLELLTNVGYGVDNDAPGQLQAELEQARLQSPRTLSAAFSSAFMWAANAGTYSPAADTTDHRNHFTPANLISSWHRAFEADERSADLKSLLGTQVNGLIHDPLAAILPLRDEGAANHMRLCDESGEMGFNIFVHGEQDGHSHALEFLPRHTRAASEAIVRRHNLYSERTFFLQQHPRAISAGVFHNDVIATSHERLLLYHEQAFLDGEDELDRLEEVFKEQTGTDLRRILIPKTELSLDDAVASYFFNSQIVSPRGSGQRDLPRMVLICPSQCRDLPPARQLIDRLVADASMPIEDVHYVELKQSMANGGGPACLRLRLPVDERTLESMCPALRIGKNTTEQLTAFITKHYPAAVSLDDFANTDFVEHIRWIATEMRRFTFGSRLIRG